jgi:hypothetical protein
MTFTIETVLGTSSELPEDTLLLQHMPHLSRKKPKITITNSSDIIRAKAIEGYIESEKYLVIEIPENIEDILMQSYAGDEFEAAVDYIAKKEKDIEIHNLKERKKLQDWELSESERFEGWQRREKEKKENYELELEIRKESIAQQQQLEKLSKGPYAIFRALEVKGKPVKSFIDLYEKNKRLNDFRVGLLEKLLKQIGIDEEVVLYDIKSLMQGSDTIDFDGTMKYLSDKTGIELPKPGKIQTFEDISLPEPDPKPNKQPAPELNIKEVPPLLNELEDIIKYAYMGKTFESLALSEEAWEESGLDPTSIYDAVRHDILHLRGNYASVRVKGKGKQPTGLTFVELDPNDLKSLKQRIPTELNSFFVRPAELAEDSYTLSVMLYGIVTNHLEGKNQNYKDILEQENSIFLKRKMYTQLIGRDGPLIENLFPNISGLDYTENLENVYLQISKEAVDVANLSLNELQGNGMFQATKLGVPVVDLIDTISHIFDSVPEPVYSLRWKIDHRNYIEHEKRSFLDNRPTPGSKLTYLGLKKLKDLENGIDKTTEEINEIKVNLGSLAEGLKILGGKTNPEIAYKTIVTYGLEKK